jgi:hypothetical protein
VISRENFVGRRRQLQNCLRTLKTDQEKVGVLLHGMGGLGKTSIVSRLWDRLPNFEKVFWREKTIDEACLIKKLRDKLIEPSQMDLIRYLENSEVSLKSRLKYLFSQLAELGEKTFLFIFDDFEWKLEPREGRYILKSEVFPILSALILAIRDTGTEHKIIITCRYHFDSELLNFFYKQGLEPLRKSELNKKLRRLEHFNSQKIPEDLRERSLTFAAGNPLLLEFLNDEVLGEQDAQAKLTELEQSPELWKNKIIWEELYQLIDEPLQQVLSHCLVYEIPVPMTALEVVCESLPNYKQQLQRGVDLGLIELSPEPKEKDRVYRVSRILPHIIPNIKRPKDETLLSFLCGKAGDKLYQLWGKQKNENGEQWSEIFRLSLADKQNPKRFREQFSKMLCVQFNVSSDLNYERELRIKKNELSSEYLFKDLEDYLRKNKWIEADEETAWIFYQYEAMAREGCATLCDLKKIDQLWLDYSNGKFGILIQKNIYLSMAETNNNYDDLWGEFCNSVGWSAAEVGLDYIGYFPLRLHCRVIEEECEDSEGKLWVGGGGWENIPSFSQRFVDFYE